MTSDVCVFVDSEMGASDSGVERTTTKTSASSWSRTNGWSWPPHPFQLIAWAVLIYLALFFYLATVPALVVGVQIACYTVSLYCSYTRRNVGQRSNTGDCCADCYMV